MHDSTRSLIRYGMQCMAQATRTTWAGNGEAEANWPAYEAALTGGAPRPQEAVLSSVFSLIRREDARGPRLGHLPGPLSLDGQAMMPVQAAETASVSLPELWAAFDRDVRAAVGSLPLPRDISRQVAEGFYHVMMRYAWALPCAYGEPGVSLFEQWKATAAMAQASGRDWMKGPASQFCIIGGDIPGIQSFVSTITSKGAGKGLRGRSYFLQLLGDAVVRRLLAELDLSWANVVYNAGGNFVILAPACTTPHMLEDLSDQVNRSLLQHFRGDLFLALASELVSVDDLAPGVTGRNDTGWVARERALKAAVAAAKLRPFAGIAGADPSAVFAPEGEGGQRSCVICHRELAPGEGVRMDNAGDDVCCRDCDGFRDLAERLTSPGVRLGIGGSEKGGAAWQQVLWEVSGLAYQLAPKPVGAELVYAFSPDDFHAGVEHGFRWLANATPLRQSEGPGQERIAAVEDMADGLRFKRLAILRMDVDNLGQLLVKGIPARSMALTSALSAALDRFFIGYLDRMAGQVAREPGMAGVAPNPRAFYVIYAGGDDVFVVCSWRHAPLLALRIREEFRRYCGRDDLGVSAGITLQGVRAPIYRGADASKDALKRAKEIQRAHSTHDKDGVSFLGEVVTWHELKEARRMAEQLYTLVKESGAPKSLLNMLGAVYELWRRDCPPTWQPGAQVIFGPWMWRLAYAVSRFDQPDSSARQALEKMRRDDLMSENSKMHLLGLAVRWAEYLAR